MSLERVQWDAENRLVGIVQASGTTGFVYDGAGHTVQETLNGTLIKQWVWCGSQPCEERDGSGNVTKRFYAQGEQIAGTPYYFTRDHLGSVREMTDSTGAIRAQYDYDPFGRVTKIQGNLSADFGFTGDYYHAASGLSLTIYRAYDPNLGRWLNRDPIGLAGGINLYAYVGNNPISRIDPLGLFDGEVSHVDKSWYSNTPGGAPDWHNPGPWMGELYSLVGPSTVYTYADVNTGSHFLGGNVMVSANYNPFAAPGMGFDNSLLFTSNAPVKNLSGGVQITGQPFGNEPTSYNAAVQYGTNSLGGFATDEEISVYFGVPFLGDLGSLGFGASWTNPAQWQIDAFALLGIKMLQHGSNCP